MPEMGPTKELAKLMVMEGEWTADMQMRQSPEAPWATSAAKAMVTSEMDGCILRTHFESTFMGMPMTGEETLTYHREKKHFDSIWIDSLSARPMYMSGQYEDGKLVMMGEDEMMGQPYQTRVTSVMTDDTTMDWLMEMSMDGGETWFESMKATDKKI